MNVLSRSKSYAQTLSNNSANVNTTTGTSNNSRQSSASPRQQRHVVTPAQSSVQPASWPSGSSVVKNILKRVESHVRLMSHLENISTSSSYTALRLRRPAYSATSPSAKDHTHHSTPQPRPIASNSTNTNIDAAPARTVSPSLPSSLPMSQPQASQPLCSSTPTGVSSAPSQFASSSDGTHKANMTNSDGNTSNSSHTRIHADAVSGNHSDNNPNSGAPADAQGHASMSAASAWSAPFAVSRVHRGSANAIFYDDVIAPCVANSTAGQSYLFLVAGPPESGRSQTLYGSPQHKEKGLVELAAEDLLRRMHAAAAVAAERQSKSNNNPSSNSSFTNNQSKSMNTKSSNHSNANTNVNDGTSGSSCSCSYAAGGATQETATQGDATAPLHPANTTTSSHAGLMVTYSAFTTRGSYIIDTVTQQPVRIETFPPPYGQTVLPHMELLTHAAAAVVIPARKFVDTSCVIQFQVYAPVDGSGRRSMATLTFVDVAAFKLPLCRDVCHLINTVRRVVNVNVGAATNPEDSDSSSNSHTDKKRAEAGAAGGAVTDTAPRFADFKLTTLLESALMGYVTLVSITAISGRADLYDSACAALHFASDLTRIHQVLLLTHLVAPRWLYETAQKLEHLRQQREDRMAQSYACGVRDCYIVTQRWLRQQIQSHMAMRVAQMIADTESIRRAVAQELQSQETWLQGQAEAVQSQCSQAETACADAQHSTATSMAQLRQAEASVTQLEWQLTQLERQTEQRVSEMRLALTAMQSTNHRSREEWGRLNKDQRVYVERAAEVEQVMQHHVEDWSYAVQCHAARQELQALGQKRTRLETELQWASELAHRRTDTLRVDRERHSRLTRLASVQCRVEQLRASVRSAGCPGHTHSRSHSSRRGSSLNSVHDNNKNNNALPREGHLSSLSNMDRVHASNYVATAASNRDGSDSIHGVTTAMQSNATMNSMAARTVASRRVSPDNKQPIRTSYCTHSGVPDALTRSGCCPCGDDDRRKQHRPPERSETSLHSTQTRVSSKDGRVELDVCSMDCNSVSTSGSIVSGSKASYAAVAAHAVHVKQPVELPVIDKQKLAQESATFDEVTRVTTGGRSAPRNPDGGESADADEDKVAKRGHDMVATAPVIPRRRLRL